MVKEVQISRAIVHYFAFFSSKNDREIELVVLHTINPVESTKWGTTFHGFFILLKDFSKKKSLKFFLTNARCLLGMWNYVQGQKEDNLFWGAHSFLRRMLGLKLD